MEHTIEEGYRCVDASVEALTQQTHALNQQTFATIRNSFAQYCKRLVRQRRDIQRRYRKRRFGWLP